MRGIDSESRLQVREIQSSGRHGRQLTQRWKDSPPSSDVFSAFPPCKTFECIRSRRSREVADAGIWGLWNYWWSYWPFVVCRGRPWVLVAVCRSWWWAPWALVGPRRRPPILAVGARCVSWGLWEERVVTRDIAFVTPPNWDVSNCMARPLILDTVSRMGLIPFRGVCRCTYILPSPPS